MSDYLAHHGIKGQKWYHRRFQNNDGSLTEAGRARYGYAKKAARFGVALAKAKGEHYGKQLKKSINRQLYKRQNDINVQSYLDQKQRVKTRLADLETQHQEECARGREHLKNMLDRVGGETLYESDLRFRNRTNYGETYSRNINEWEATAANPRGRDLSYLQSMPNRLEASKNIARSIGAGNTLPLSISYSPYDRLASTSGYKRTAEAGRSYVDALASYEYRSSIPSYTRYFDD